MFLAMIVVFYLTYLSVLIFFLRRVRQFESVKLHNLNSLFLQLKAIRAALQSISSFEELDKLYEGLNIRGVEPHYRKELIQRVIRSGYQPFDPVFPMDDWFSQAEQMAKYRLTILSVFGWNLCFMSATCSIARILLLVAIFLPSGVGGGPSYHLFEASSLFCCFIWQVLVLRAFCRNAPFSWFGSLGCDQRSAGLIDYMLTGRFPKDHDLFSSWSNSRLKERRLGVDQKGDMNRHAVNWAQGCFSSDREKKIIFQNRLALFDLLALGGTVFFLHLFTWCLFPV